MTQLRNCAESGGETPSVIIIISSISQQQHCTTRDIHSIVRPMQKVTLHMYVHAESDARFHRTMIANEYYL